MSGSSQFNDEHSEFGETMPNLLDVPAVGAKSISEGMLYSTGGAKLAVDINALVR